MDKIMIEIPASLMHAANLTADEVRTELAIRLYQMEKLSRPQADELAADPKAIESFVLQKNSDEAFDLNEFLDWASHDLKTPLNAVIGFTKVVLKGIDGPVNETQQTDLTTAFNGGQRMLALVTYLVDIARINNGKTQPSKSDLDAKDLITEITDRWKGQNPTKPLNVMIDLSQPGFSIDRAHMKQIISYLLTLATLRVSEGTISLFANDTEQRLNVRIEGNGKTAMDKFEMDTAMIIYIAKNLLRMHGGQLDDPQETDDGITFSFSLPR